MENETLDQAIGVLQEHKDFWAGLPIPCKIDLLLQMRQRLARCSQDWVTASVQGKQIDPCSPWVGEEWTGGPWALANAISGYLGTMRALSRGDLPKPKKILARPGGRIAAQIFPNNIYDKIMLSGITAEVWMQPEVSKENLDDYMAGFYREKRGKGKVALVLGAGNVASIAPRDVLHRLYVLGQVVMLKMSPVNDYLGPILEDIFAPYIEASFLRFAYGGAEVGEILAHHEGIDEIHMTGSACTYEAIVFGTSPEGEQRKQRSQVWLNKPITSELGGVCPTIVLPGQWSQADLRFQAENVVTMKLHNGGFNCVASQVLVLPEAWEQREAFLDAIRQVVRELPPRKAYYPGAAERQRRVVEAHPEAELLGGEVPRTLVTGLDPNAAHELCFETEVFGAVYAQVSLPGKDVAEYLHNAVRFCNERLYGTLGATIIVHPKVIRELGPMLEEAIADLRYGSVGVNVWNAAAFLLVQASWGAYPGHTPDDIQSGSGVVGNAFMFEKPEKTVVRGSFYPLPRTWLHGDPAFLPKPPWFVTNKTAHITTKGVAKITLDPHFRYLPAILLSALRG